MATSQKVMNLREFLNRHPLITKGTPQIIESGTSPLYILVITDSKKFCTDNIVLFVGGTKDKNQHSSKELVKYNEYLDKQLESMIENTEKTFSSMLDKTPDADGRTRCLITLSLFFYLFGSFMIEFSEDPDFLSKWTQDDDSSDNKTMFKYRSLRACDYMAEKYKELFNEENDIPSKFFLTQHRDKEFEFFSCDANEVKTICDA